MKDESKERGAGMRLLRVCFILPPSSLLLGLSGCNVIGALAAKAGPEATVAAQYAPAKKPTVILVENFHNPASLRLESDAIARHLAEELKMHEVAPVVEPAEVEGLRQAKGGAYRKMPLDAIGRELGARQVIYVDLERFDLVQAIASNLPTGKAEARVRVVDDAGELLWPLDSAGGYPISVSIKPERASNAGGGATEQAVRRRLHAALADRVARLFYNTKAESSDGAQEKFN